MIKRLGVVLAAFALSVSAWAAGIDVNSATAEELSQLDGIGEVIAARIVEERNEGGPFVNLQDLVERVNGVGPSFIDKNSDRAVAEGSD